MQYDAGRRVLMIAYRGNRGRYRYFDVPPEVWDTFRTAKSKGTYLNEVFKDLGFRYERVQEPVSSGDSEPNLRSTRWP